MAKAIVVTVLIALTVLFIGVADDRAASANHGSNVGTIALKATSTVPASDVDSATIGSQVAVHVHDQSLAAAQSTTVTVTSDTDNVGIVVILAEVAANTTTFTGFFTLSTATNAAAGTLAATVGDTVTAKYTDTNNEFLQNLTLTDSLLVVSPSDADLALTKTASPDPVDVGQSLTYTVTITNAGPAEASGVTLTDVLTGGQSFSASTPSQGSCSESQGTVTCDLGTMAASATSTVTIVVVPSKAGLLGNTADVFSTTNDPFTTNNSATTITTVLDASLVDTQGPQISNLSPGDGTITSQSTLAYTADITDLGSGVDLDTAVFLVNTTADNVAAAAFVDPFTSFTFIEDAEGNITGITLTLAGLTLANEVWITVRASDVAGNETTFDADAVTPGIQMASIVIDTTSPLLEDAFTGVWYEPVNQVLNFNDPRKILVTFSDNLTNLDPGSISAADFTVQNHTVVQADWFDDEPATSTGPGLGTVAIRQSVFLTLQNQLGLDETPTVTIVGDGVTDQAGNVLTVGSTTALDRITVLDADLSVAKSDSRDPVIAATNLSYTLTVANSGPSDATGVTLTDTLPAELTFISSTPGSPTCTESGGTVTCNFGALDSGASTTTIMSVAVIASSTVFVINNTASVTANEADPDTTDNSVLESTTVIPYEGFPSLSWWSLVAMAVTMVLLVLWRLRQRGAAW